MIYHTYFFFATFLAIFIMSNAFIRRFHFLGICIKTSGSLRRTRSLSTRFHNSVVHTPSQNRIRNNGAKMLTMSMALAAFSMTSAAPAVTPVEYFRKDYSPLPYTTTDIYMDFQLGLEESEVTTRSTIRRTQGVKEDLRFDGEDNLDLLELKINGELLCCWIGPCHLSPYHLVRLDTYICFR